MTEQQKELLTGLLTKEQIQAIAQIKDSLRPEEINELRAAGERLLKNVKTQGDLANLIESAAKTGAPPDIRSPRLRQLVGGMASKISSDAKTGHEQAREKRPDPRQGSSPSGRGKRRSSPKRGG